MSTDSDESRKIEMRELRKGIRESVNPNEIASLKQRLFRLKARDKVIAQKQKLLSSRRLDDKQTIDRLNREIAEKNAKLFKFNQDFKAMLKNARSSNAFSSKHQQREIERLKKVITNRNNKLCAMMKQLSAKRGSGFDDSDSDVFDKRDEEILALSQLVIDLTNENAANANQPAPTNRKEADDLMEKLIQRDDRIAELDKENQDLIKRASTESFEMMELRKETQFNQTHKDLPKHTKRMQLFQPKRKKKRDANDICIMVLPLIFITIIIIGNFFIYSSYFDFDYFINGNEVVPFSPFKGEYESDFQLFWPSVNEKKGIFSQSLDSVSGYLFGHVHKYFVAILFGICAGCALYGLLKTFSTWSMPKFVVRRLEHKAWKRKKKDGRLSSRWSLDGFRILRLFK